MSGFRLQEPIWLLLILPILIVTAWSGRRRRRDSVLYSSVDLLRGLPVSPALRLKRALPWFWACGLTLASVALARPQQGIDEFRIRTEGIAILMCVDRSGSMQALDFELDGKRVNRLEVVKSVFRDFVAGGAASNGPELRGRPDDLLGLVAFGGFAEASCPLTLDHAALLEVLGEVRIPQPIRDARGVVINARLLQEELATAIGDALALAVERLKHVKAKSKVIILLSDGENTAGIIDPFEAVEAARLHGIRVYTIGVGSTGAVPFPAYQEDGRVVLTTQMLQLDERTLRTIASLTGGTYYNARDTATLRRIYAEIDALEKTLTEGRLYTEYRELYRWALIPALALILVELLLVSTRFRSLP